MRENLNKVIKSDIYVFGWVGLTWLLVSLCICQVMSSDLKEFVSASQGTLLLWTLSVLDLLALKKLISVIFQIYSLAGKTSLKNTVQGLSWGVFKILCLGLFVLVLLKGHKIPMYGLLLGTGTLGVIPVIGGFFWSQRILRNA